MKYALSVRNAHNVKSVTHANHVMSAQNQMTAAAALVMRNLNVTKRDKPITASSEVKLVFQQSSLKTMSVKYPGGHGPVVNNASPGKITCTTVVRSILLSSSQRLKQAGTNEDLQ